MSNNSYDFLTLGIGNLWENSLGMSAFTPGSDVVGVKIIEPARHFSSSKQSKKRLKKKKESSGIEIRSTDKKFMTDLVDYLNSYSVEPDSTVIRVL